ncbi:MAG TPA: DNA recombination protein RmuC [Acidobacteriaceae bacterium]|nr:DNA recombination protein RmuC [Acidobacteriaceae bacterium]
MLPEIGIALVAGLALGFLVAWALGQKHRQRAAQLEQQLAERAAALESIQRERDSARQELATQQQAAAERDKAQSVEIARLTAERASLEQDSEKAANALEEQRAEITRIGAQLLDSETERASLKTALESEQKSHSDKLTALTDQFKSLAGDILKENSKAFTEQNQINIGQLLNPLREKFEEFQKEVKSLNESGLTGRTQLKEQIENLAKLNTKLSDDANNLATALKGSSQTQGRWGEQLLETILETAGLRKGYEYLTQESFTREERSADGRLRAQLDVLVRLPEDRNIIIDSKVSLNAYDAYCSAQDDADRDAALKEHLKSVRSHILGLSRRDYHLLDGLNSPDFVVMFVPLEPAFILAISRDGHLWQEAWDKNVLLVSPSTVLFVLRTVAQLWRQEQQTKNVQEIVRRGGELYDKLAAFAADLTKVGKSLDEARNSYDDACKKLSTGKGNAIRQAEMLRSLGVKPSKVIPMVLIEQDAEDAPLELAASMEKTEA